MNVPRLPEPDFRLMGYLNGSPTEQDRAEWHDRWHRDNPKYGECTSPEQPRSAHRPGAVERSRRWLRWWWNP